ncbi:nuclear transport factor 2 family protein [Micromonospora sp. NPDC050686]|uniref:nuclear transport factor 2 family protein n=1 Tax=Micromonospora sp. NPDC050686 TaxID=3154631 RepID=UPI00340ABD1D
MTSTDEAALSPRETTMLRTLLAEHEITAVIYRLARASDRGDVELAASCYHAGATEDHGGFVGPAEEFRTRQGQIQFAETPAIPLMWHSVTNIRVELDGDRAFVESLVLVWQRLVKDGVEFDIPVAGRYLDTFARLHGEWRIAARTLVFDASRVELPTPSYWDVFDKPRETLRLGSRSDRDISYDLLRTFRAGGAGEQ